MKTNDSEYNIIKEFYMRSLTVLKKRKAALFVSASILFILLLFWTGVFSFGYDAFLGSNYLGAVSARAETEMTLTAINGQLDVPIKESLNFYPKIVIRGTLTPDSEIARKIKLASGQMQEGTGFTVDGKTLFALKDNYDMQHLIDEYTAPYKTPNTTSAVLEGNISYENGIYANKLFVSYKEASHLLEEKAFNVLTSENITETEIIERTTEQIEDSTLYVGDVKVKNEGADGKKEVTKIVLKRNGEVISEEYVSEKTLAVPVARVEEVGTLALSGIGSGAFSRPVSGGITSNFGERWGKMHKGTDFAGETGEGVKAADSGTVVFAGSEESFGKLIIIDHKNGYETYYAHLSAIFVSEGEKIKSGQVIGAIGSTGNSTGPHLHFEIHKNQEAQNPMNYLSK